MSDDFDNMDSNFDDGLTDDDKLWAFLAYVFTPLLPIILMLMEDKKKRPFIKEHNAQALIWGLINVFLVSMVTWLCLGVPSLIFWGIGVYWGWQAYQGKSVTIPILTDFVKGQGWA